ncbi:hypothetical protein RHGRI_012545 [Rhododendron griersonianum]|uniref:Uncharacterized protein n=1 Tax=Rhododendron griersonianum TaxID=479676 RepID=A0AAV6KQY7_9ERIC|nr:hypothetical protein RHGRI_012545 [Rhododendron griersonianum]
MYRGSASDGPRNPPSAHTSQAEKPIRKLEPIEPRWMARSGGSPVVWAKALYCWPDPKKEIVAVVRDRGGMGKIDLPKAMPKDFDSARLVVRDGRDTDDQKQSPADMTVFVQNLLQQMLFVCFFNYNALDEMGSRIDELEQSINELRTEMGQEGSPSPSAALKPKEEPKTADDSA